MRRGFARPPLPSDPISTAIFRVFVLVLSGAGVGAALRACSLAHGTETPDNFASVIAYAVRQHRAIVGMAALGAAATLVVSTFLICLVVDHLHPRRILSEFRSRLHEPAAAQDARKPDRNLSDPP